MVRVGHLKTFHTKELRKKSSKEYTMLSKTVGDISRVMTVGRVPIAQKITLISFMRCTVASLSLATRSIATGN